MRLYHYLLGNKRVYAIEPGTSLEKVFDEVKTWPGTKLVLVKG